MAFIKKFLGSGNRNLGASMITILFLGFLIIVIVWWAPNPILMRMTMGIPILRQGPYKVGLLILGIFYIDFGSRLSGLWHGGHHTHQQCQASNIASLRCRWGSPVEKAAAMTSGSGVLGRGRPRPWSEWTNASGRCRCTSPGRSGFKSSPRTQNRARGILFEIKDLAADPRDWLADEVSSVHRGL